MTDFKGLESLLESVEQFIHDENKTVTFEFLSQSCGIHVNLAKNVLEKYAEKLKEKPSFSQYQIIYSLCGYVGKNLKFIVVRDDQLDAAKSKLEKVISSSIFSIQKGKLGSLDELYNCSLTDLKRSIQQCSGQAAIQYKKVKLKSASELSNKIASVEMKVPEPAKPKPSNQASIKKEELAANLGAPKTDSKTSKTSDADVNIDGSKEKTSKPPSKKPVEKPAIATLFAKQHAKGPLVKKASPVVAEEPLKQASNKRLVREPISDEENENVCANAEKVSTENNKKRFKLSDEKEENLKKSSLDSKTKKPKKQARNSNTSSAKTQRKRIQQISDSESSGEEEEDQDVVLASPEKPVQVVSMSDDEDFLNASVVEPSGNNLKRSCKMVDETFMDENGYIVTKKSFKTCEETIQPESSKKPEEQKSSIPPKPQEAATTKQPSPPGKTKQKSITSFFTRK